MVPFEPKHFAKGDQVRTATSPAEAVDLRHSGWRPLAVAVEVEATVSDSGDVEIAPAKVSAEVAKTPSTTVKMAAAKEETKPDAQ